MLADLSWVETRDIQDQVDLVLLPVGSNEQHGPNLSMRMDIACPTEFCRRASAMMAPRVAVAQGIPWGISYHHMNFPGTISLSPQTFIQLIVEIIGSLHHHGFKRFLIVNGHGGNVAAIAVAAVQASEELGVPFVGACSYSSFPDPDVSAKYITSDITGHACESETARAMVLAPEIVKHGSLAPGELTDLAYGFRKEAAKYKVSIPYKFDKFTRNGALGDASQATLEFGEALVASGLKNFAQFCADLIEANPV